MSEEDKRICYLATVKLLKRMLFEGLISKEEYADFETVFAKKYDVDLSVIFR